jgi:hypothetical protein
MHYKVTFAVGFAAGYVLGARAGRERYDAILRSARDLKDRPAVQEAAGVLQAQATEAFDAVKSTVGGKVGIGPGAHPGRPTVTPPPSTPYPASATLGPDGDGPHH